MEPWHFCIYEGYHVAILACLLVSTASSSAWLNHSLCLETCSCVGQTKVECSNRYLRIVPAGIPLTTENLILSRNLITNIQDGDFFPLPALAVLRLTANFISAIQPQAFDRLPKLSTLHVDENCLIDISTIPPILIINLAFNFIQRVNCHSQQTFGFAGDRESLINLSNNFIVGFLNLSLPVNIITAVSSNIRVFDIHQIQSVHLITLIDFRDNGIRTLPDLRNLTKLQKLFLSGNPIHVVQISHWPQGTTLLQIHLEKGTHINQNSSSRINHLYISGMGISHLQDIIGFMDVHFIEVIVISKSLVSSISDLPALPKLRSLTVKHSELIGVITFSPYLYPKLRVIDFRNNSIT
ncbi:leucine-rich repeat-containing G-protein coupled receptor 4-like [Lytechinus pictus]|uniref:leucine-rich repeat-containing G-protein coupled receptor 4-like n=1 Tax=Lytechinus pictus TaxID=7653 RepID=UPI00240DE2B9|nr:leucine-rich repeat-containing G-protein coupled receptor 4-like [Lytechinus pictus]